jgi:DNA-binding PadR family transcriptional regulator
MNAAGLIEETSVTPAIDSTAPALTGRRARVVYAITAEGKEVFSEWANRPGPEAWEDEGFAAHLAFFSATEARTRLRILEGRRSRLEERVDSLRDSLTRGREKVDAYTLQLQQHGLEGAEREVRWLTELIDQEVTSTPPHTTATSNER